MVEQLAYGGEVVEYGGETVDYGGGVLLDFPATGGRFGPRNARIQGVAPFPRFATLTTTEHISVEVGERYRYRAWAKWDYDQVTTPTPDLRLRARYYNNDRQARDAALIGQLALATDPDLVTDQGVWKRIIGLHTVPSDEFVFAKVEMRGDYDVAEDPHWWHIDGVMMRQVRALRSAIATSTVAVNALNDGSGAGWSFIRSVTAGTPGDTVHLKATCDARVAADSAVGEISLRVRLMRYDADGVSNPTVIDGPHVFLSPVAAGSKYPEYRPSGMTFPTPPADPQHLGDTPWTRIQIGASDTSGARGEYVYRAEFSTTGPNGRAQVRNRVMAFNLE